MKPVFLMCLGLCILCVTPGVSLEQSCSGTLIKMPDGNYTLVSLNANMEVDPNVGARIVSLKFGGFEFLTGPEIMKGGYGSTFWPSPQSRWTWPPPVVLDSQPYSATSTGDTVRLVSGKDELTGLQVEKEFFPGKGGRFSLLYTMTNTTDSVIKAAPWEITRVHTGGLLFFPIGDNPLGKKYFDPAPVSVVDGIAWYEVGKSRPSNNLLTTADGTEGWAAYAIGGKLFVKKFPRVAREDIAPGEGSVLFYVSKEADYIEFEIQGKYGSLKPGERSTWHVEWIVANIPANIKAVPRDSSLVDFAREIIK